MREYLFLGEDILSKENEEVISSFCHKYGFGIIQIGIEPNPLCSAYNIFIDTHEEAIRKFNNKANPDEIGYFLSDSKNISEIEKILSDIAAQTLSRRQAKNQSFWAGSQRGTILADGVDNEAGANSESCRIL